MGDAPRLCPRCEQPMTKIPYGFVTSWWQCEPCNYAEVIPLGYCKTVTVNLAFEDK